jgi:hypothetical protein
MICYLPGLFLFALGKKETLEFEDLILAFPCSIGISSIGILGVFYLGAPFKYLLYLLCIIAGITVIFFVRKKSHIKIHITSKELAFIFFACTITLLLSIPVLFGADRIDISAHGFFHSTFVTQILNGIFPPENAGLGGTSISYQWGFHALIAAISSEIDFHPLQVMSALNVLSLLFIFCIVYRSSKALNFTDGYRYLACLAVIGLMRSDAGIFFVNKLISGNLMDISHASLAEMRPLDVLQNWIWGGGAPWFDRRLFFLNKFYNANSMPLGILLCLSYFLLVLIYSEKTHERKYSKIYMISISLVLIASCFVYPPLAIIPLIHAPLWTGLVFFKRQDFRTRLNHSLEMFIPYLIAVVAVFPYLMLVSSSDGEPAIRVAFWDQSIRNIIVFWLPTPFIFFGVWSAFKKYSSSTLLWLVTGTFLCLSLSTFTRVALWNSGKFTFILSFFYALFFVYALSELINWISHRWLKTTIVTSSILFLFFTPILTELSYIISPWFRDNTYSFSGRHIVFAKDMQRNEAYTWIRKDTPPNALLLLTYVETSVPDNIAQNSTYEPAALTERNLFVINDSFTQTDPEYKRRIRLREKILDEPESPEVKSFLNSINRPIYLLVEDNLPSLFLKEERFNQFTENPDKAFQLKFHNDRQSVYLVKN